MGRFLRFCGSTDVGCEREHNEDSYGVQTEYDLYVVADGMGGHRAGDVASQMAIAAVSEFFVATEKEDITWPFHFDPSLSFPINRLITAIQVANNRIFQASMKSNEHQGMGTTVVALHIVDEGELGHLAHVGDSRCYRIRGDQLQLMTMDHSLVNDYLRAAPDLTEDQLSELPRNVITRALGMQETVLVDVTTIQPEVGDIYLMCSDGLNGMVEDSRILEVVVANKGDLDKASSELIGEANQNGGEDNITVILVQVDES